MSAPEKCHAVHAHNYAVRWRFLKGARLPPRAAPPAETRRPLPSSVLLAVQCGRCIPTASLLARRSGSLAQTQQGSGPE